ncbi:TetR/AcrR family transcriptional regulator [Pseudomonas sp. REP124]|uniref:TetR/AcrR family transcriptional regulator n=1 Tax=Pseudomonas sp. REP124 TaxID=2875731 RepID=UPI001CC9021B|nr:TetR/AcrR family transcriptional regulator [Pseudomonas sp. REP124]MBZ9780968.1 TetR/AcrR family transcriptional regulator [Pseudomonas sp. REP124]
MAGVRQFNEEQTLDLAMELFWRQGFGATSMPQLAEATGVLRGSLYNAYGDKQALFLEVFGRYKARFLDAARQALDEPQLDLALKAFFAYTIASMTLGTPPRGCLTTKTAIDEAANSEPIREALRGLLDGLEALLVERFSTEEARESLTLDPVAAARLVVSQTRGIVVIERLYQDAQRLQDIADSLVAVLMHPTVK